MSSRLGVGPAFSFSRRIDGPATSSRVFAFAGIAKPQQFFDELERAGWQVVGRRTFRDHHRYSTNEIAGIARAARQADADMIVTTSKDGVRLSEAHRAAANRMPILEVPLHISIDPAFQVWLHERLARARSA
jgi:tetraacyldisaccharide 4'-kinase